MRKGYRVIVLPEAQRDIRGIVLYIARELSAPQAALDLEDDFEKGIRSLCDMPERVRRSGAWGSPSPRYVGCA